MRRGLLNPLMLCKYVCKIFVTTQKIIKGDAGNNNTMASKVSQAEYLKKYTSGSNGAGDAKKQKRKKVKTKPLQSFKIVDADEEARASEIRPIEVDEEGNYHTFYPFLNITSHYI